MKYIAFKLRSLDHWVWFKQTNIDRSESRIIGKDGWLGHTRELVSIDIEPGMVEGVIESNGLGIEHED